jgi:hypothetical protein
VLGVASISPYVDEIAPYFCEESDGGPFAFAVVSDVKMVHPFGGPSSVDDLIPSYVRLVADKF